MNSPKCKSSKVSNKVPFLTPIHERMWSLAVDCVRRAPHSGLSLDWDSQVQLLLIALDIEITPVTLNVTFTSALEGESLSWLLSRIEHEQSKSS